MDLFFWILFFGKFSIPCKTYSLPTIQFSGYFFLGFFTEEITVRSIDFELKKLSINIILIFLETLSVNCLIDFLFESMTNFKQFSFFKI